MGWLEQVFARFAGMSGVGLAMLVIGAVGTFIFTGLANKHEDKRNTFMALSALAVMLAFVGVIIVFIPTK